MAIVELKKNRGNYEVNVFYKKGSKSQYNNILDKDYNKIADVLIDLYIQGFAIDKAVKIFIKRLRRKDWLGL